MPRKKAEPEALTGAADQDAMKQLKQLGLLNKNTKQPTVALKTIASEIKTLRKRVAADLIRIGRLLIVPRATVAHGEWGPWLRDEFDWSQDTAERYIGVVKMLDEGKLEIRSVRNLDVSSLYVLAQPSTPQEARDQVAQMVDQGNPPTPAEVRRLAGKPAKRERKVAVQDSHDSPEAAHSTTARVLPEAEIVPEPVRVAVTMIKPDPEVKPMVVSVTMTKPAESAEPYDPSADELSLEEMMRDPVMYWREIIEEKDLWYRLCDAFEIARKANAQGEPNAIVIAMDAMIALETEIRDLAAGAVATEAPKPDAAPETAPSEASATADDADLALPADGSAPGFLDRAKLNGGAST
jgi:hypothetical protein